MPLRPLTPEATAFIEAVNSGNEEALLALFVADARVNDWGRIYLGRNEIEEWSGRELIGVGGIITPIRTRTRGNAITVTCDYRSGHVNGTNAFTFTGSGGQLSEVKIRKGFKFPWQ